MGRHTCGTCELLKEFYRLKLNQFLLAARSASAWSRYGRGVGDEELQTLKDESLNALTALLRHAKACYGLASDEAA